MPSLITFEISMKWRFGGSRPWNHLHTAKKWQKTRQFWDDFFPFWHDQTNGKQRQLFRGILSFESSPLIIFKCSDGQLMSIFSASKKFKT
jgi:hypothetical protein